MRIHREPKVTFSFGGNTGCGEEVVAMLKEREFRIALVPPESGASPEPAAKPTTVRYNGPEVSRCL